MYLHDSKIRKILNVHLSSDSQFLNISIFQQNLTDAYYEPGMVPYLGDM